MVGTPAGFIIAAACCKNMHEKIYVYSLIKTICKLRYNHRGNYKWWRYRSIYFISIEWFRNVSICIKNTQPVILVFNVVCGGLIKICTNNAENV